MADQGIKSYRLGMTYFADLVCIEKHIQHVVMSVFEGDKMLSVSYFYFIFSQSACKDTVNYILDENPIE